jgi:hypothetical protein
MTLRVKTEPGPKRPSGCPSSPQSREIDRRVPVLSVQTLAQHRGRVGDVVALTIVSAIFGALGAIALFLSSVGVYGLRAYLVARAHAGVRHPPGARRARARRWCVRWSARAAASPAAGMSAGALLAAALTVLLQQSGLLFEVSPTDPVVMVRRAARPARRHGALASYIPARAAR